MTAMGSGLLPVRQHQVPRERSDSVLDSVEFAVAEIGDGRPVIVVDDEDRENEGDIIFAASLATPGVVAFTVRHSSGYICAPVSEDIADRLELVPQTRFNQDVRGTAYTVTVDATSLSGTGISAVDRAVTLRTLADPDATAADFRRPGHVVPLRARRGGVLVRAGHTEAAIDLTEMAGLPPAGVICEVVSERDPLDMARIPELRDFCDTHDLALISIAQLIAHRSRVEHQVERVAAAQLPLVQGGFVAHGYRSTVTGREIVALVLGDISDGKDVLVRVHSECLTGDVLGAFRCTCGRRLQAGLDAIGQEGRGVLLYLRGHEGTGMDLLSKLRSYQALDQGTEAPTPRDVADPKGYGTGAQVLVDLGVRSMIMLSDHPVRRAALDGYGLTLTGVRPLGVDTP